MGIQVTIRDIDQQTYKEFKAEAVQRGLTLGIALTLAMKKFRSTLPRKRFTALKPIDWGKGTEHVSEEVDTIIYGE